MSKWDEEKNFCRGKVTFSFFLGLTSDRGQVIFKMDLLCCRANENIETTLVEKVILIESVFKKSDIL